ncbi:MAG: thiol reductase thioredoxin [Actinomycetales bacterium]|nr:thiol reductase thioredoxin [Actinomycetales bacterium]
MSTVALTADSFRAMLRDEGITLVEFWGSWCKPCLTFMPVFEAAAEEHADVRFATLDTQAEVTLAAELGVSGVPTVRAYRDGVQLMDFSGPMTMEMIRSVVEQVRALDMDDVIERAVAREPLPAIRPMG